jgi:hypothetical protein
MKFLQVRINMGFFTSYFVNTTAHVSVAVRLAESGPTQGVANTMANDPEIEEAVMPCVPLPEKEQVGRPRMAPADTVIVIAVSCAPATVPVIVALTSSPCPTSRTSGPDTLAPVWTTIQLLTKSGPFVCCGPRIVPVQVPARLSSGAGVGVGVGVVGVAAAVGADGAVGDEPPLEPQPAAAARHTIRSAIRTRGLCMAISFE